jgi:ADP-ribose pyrophosphatase
MELLEEVGVEAGKIEILKEIMPLNPALEDTAAMAIIATDCRRVSKQSLDDTEVAEVREVTIIEFKNMVRSGEIRDCKTIAVTYRALEYLGFL